MTSVSHSYKCVTIHVPDSIPPLIVHPAAIMTQIRQNPLLTTMSWFIINKIMAFIYFFLERSIFAMHKAFLVWWAASQDFHFTIVLTENRQDRHKWGDFSPGVWSPVVNLPLEYRRSFHPTTLKAAFENLLHKQYRCTMWQLNRKTFAYAFNDVVRLKWRSIGTF